MATKSVEKDCFIVLNVKLLITALLTQLVLLEIFVYPGAKRVIYGPELNSKTVYSFRLSGILIDPANEYTKVIHLKQIHRV